MFDTEVLVDARIHRRREAVFLLLAGIFLGSLTMLNILGVSKIISIDIFGVPLVMTVGVLPYPITFLCTDFISELYGKRRANLVVWVGLLLNIWVLFILWLGGVMSPVPTFPSDEFGDILPVIKDGKLDPSYPYVFYKIREMTTAVTIASMLAYLIAQFCDVHIFHFLKKITNGKHLWIRNNGSTLISQLVDSFAVIILAHWFSNAFHLKGNDDAYAVLMSIIFGGYVFKLVSALIDTIPFYLGTKWLSKYLAINPNAAYEKKD